MALGSYVLVFNFPPSCTGHTSFLPSTVQLSGEFCYNVGEAPQILLCASLIFWCPSSSTITKVAVIFAPQIGEARRYIKNPQIYPLARIIHPALPIRAKGKAVQIILSADYIFRQYF